MNQQNAIKIIKSIRCPWLQQPLADQVSVTFTEKQCIIKFAYYLEPYKAILSKVIQDTLRAELGHIDIVIEQVVPSYQTQLPSIKVHQVKNLIAVSSGKGGVGKTTSACHLALQLSKSGAKVGVFDADMYGPNVPLMMGTAQKQAATTSNNQFIPIDCHGISTMSLAYLVDPAKPMVWRGPMLSKTLLQILMQTKWPALDYLLIDLPPGTGDTQLTLAQKIPLTGSIIVTTPHPMAQADALKGIKMFEKVNVPILGQIINMAPQACQQCGYQDDAFMGDAQALAQDATILGSVPYTQHLMRSLSEVGALCDNIYSPIVANLIGAMIKLPKHKSSQIPTIITE